MSGKTGIIHLIAAAAAWVSFLAGGIGTAQAGEWEWEDPPIWAADAYVYRSNGLGENEAVGAFVIAEEEWQLEWLNIGGFLGNLSSGLIGETDDYMLAQLNLQTDDEFGPFADEERDAAVWKCRSETLGSNRQRFLVPGDPATERMARCVNRAAMKGGAVKLDMVFDYIYDSGGVPAWRVVGTGMCQYRGENKCEDFAPVFGTVMPGEECGEARLDGEGQFLSQTCAICYDNARDFRAGLGGRACGSSRMSIGHTVSLISLEYFDDVMRSVYDDNRSQKLALQFRREDGSNYIFNLDTFSLAELFKYR